jgi:hypothetical protein
MPPRRNKLPPIIVEWAESLIGLSMRVPDDWWVGCSGHNLHDGKIVSFDISTQKLNLLLNSKEEPDPYLMAYDAVCIYSDEDSSTFNKYQLTYQAVRDGDEEIETTEGIRYTKTTSDEWDKIEDGDGRSIDPIECTVDEEFSVNSFQAIRVFAVRVTPVFTSKKHALNN